jgi:hypothetical protein
MTSQNAKYDPSQRALLRQYKRNPPGFFPFEELLKGVKLNR